MNKKKVTLLTAVLLSLACLFAGCQKTAPTTDGDEQAQTEETDGDGDFSVENISAGDTSYPLTITDGLGNEVTIEQEPQRIISLSPANTEILYALGAGERVKGRTDYCNYPQEASEVDSIGTYTSPNMELILSLEPEIVFASDYMDDAIRGQVEEAGAKVVVFSANSIASVKDAILQAGQILNLNETAAGITDSMDEQLKGIQETVSGAAPKSIFVDLGDYYSAGPGSLIDDMLQQIGAQNIVAETGKTWPQLSVESIIEKNPDLYFSLFTSPEELRQVPGLGELDCMKEENLLFLEGLSEEADMIQRPGPRVVDGVRLLAQKIYPELF